MMEWKVALKSHAISWDGALSYYYHFNQKNIYINVTPFKEMETDLVAVCS